jgi:ATP-dependent DNA ligase
MKSKKNEKQIFLYKNKKKNMNTLPLTPTTTTTLPTLYCVSKNGKTKEWRIKVEEFRTHSTIVISFGYTGSTRFIETTRTITKGKNVGKSNATTHHTQAILEANAKWKKKCDNEGFVQFVNVDHHQQQNADPIPLPMLAHDYKKQFSKIRFPCYLQPKLDGFRCLHPVGSGKLWSRQSKEFLNCDHIMNSLNQLKTEFNGITLDGELYCHNSLFEDLGVLRKKRLIAADHTKMKKIKYHIYDVVDESAPFEERLKVLERLSLFITSKKLESICVVSTTKIERQAQIKEYHLENVLKGYEGTMIRNSFSGYLQKFRSYDLQKYKDFQDSEFKIVGFTKEQGDLVVFICETENGVQFNVPCKGTRGERNSVYLEATKNPKNFIGKKLWVQFFEYTADHIPRFPKSYRAVRESIREFF